MNRSHVSRPLTVREQVAQSIRDAIVDGRLVQGEPVQQDELAASLGVSRTPIRQALERLAAEGWIEDRPNRAAIVAPLDPADCEELFEIRAALECLAARRSIPRLQEDDRKEIVEAHSAMTHASAENYELTHRAFHLSIYRYAGPRLLRLIEHHLDQAERYLRFERTRMEVSTEDGAEHEAIMAAAVRAEVSAALRILHPHTAIGGRDIARQLRNRAPDS